VTFGIERLTVNQAVEVRRSQQVGGGKPIERWEAGARFSHYKPDGRPVIEKVDGGFETLPSLEDVRPV
jgi:hypothetical protein